MPVNFNPRPPLPPLGRETRFALPPSLMPQFGGAAMSPEEAAVLGLTPEGRPVQPPPQGFNPETDMPLPPPPGPRVVTNPETGRRFYEESPAMYDEQGNLLQEAVWKPLSAVSERTSPFVTAAAQVEAATGIRGLEAIVDTPYGKMTAQEAAALRSALLPPPPTPAEESEAYVGRERQLRGEGLGSYYEPPISEYQRGLLREQGLSREQTATNQARQAELEQWRLQGWRPGTAQEVAAYYASLDKLRRFYGGG